MSDQSESKEGHPVSPAASGEPSARPQMVLMRVIGEFAEPTLAETAKQLGVALEDIDAEYGIVTVDLERGIYAARVRGDRVAGSAFSPGRGPFSDPIVSTFGTPTAVKPE
jgi:hypothetical protein